MLFHPGSVFENFLQRNVDKDGGARLDNHFLTLFARVGLALQGEGLGTLNFMGKPKLTQATFMPKITTVAFIEPKF